MTLGSVSFWLSESSFAYQAFGYASRTAFQDLNKYIGSVHLKIQHMEYLAMLIWVVFIA